jgi:hypothetical protein
LFPASVLFADCLATITTETDFAKDYEMLKVLGTGATAEVKLAKALKETDKQVLIASEVFLVWFGFFIMLVLISYFFFSPEFSLSYASGGHQDRRQAVGDVGGRGHRREIRTRSRNHGVR